MPQVVASPSCRVFMPVTNSGVQGLRMNPVQPHSPTQSVPVQPPVAPAAPPPTVQTVDTSNAPEGIVTLTLSLVFWSGIHCKSTYIPKIVYLPKVMPTAEDHSLKMKATYLPILGVEEMFHRIFSDGYQLKKKEYGSPDIGAESLNVRDH